jgi:tRNA (guanine37-N1)-methyltransferase
MRLGEVGVEPHSQFVALDRGGEIARLEQPVRDVDERRHAGCVGRQRLGEGGIGGGAVAAGEFQQRALVVHQGAFALAGRGGQRRDVMRFGRGEVARAHRPFAALEVGRRPGRGNSQKSREERHAPMLYVDVITLFPEMFAPVIGLSIVGRAVERGLVTVRVHDLIDALAPGERADERPFGGGPGMVLRIEPLARVLDGILAAAPAGERRRIVLTAADGRAFAHGDAAAFAGLNRLVLICGHYEGVDERLAALYPIESFSLGGFVLTGGEIPAMAFLDATIRLLDGAIAADSREAESFVTGDDAVDHPSYTQPRVFRGVSVPDVLLSGDHAKIAEWRRARSRERAALRKAR